jgi:hypothetical protein
MSGFGAFGLAASVALLVALAVVARRFLSTAGRHSIATNRVKVDKLTVSEDTEKTVIQRDLFGANVISGYRVGDESNDPTVDKDYLFVTRPRPYIEYWWRQQVEDTVVIAEFGWFDGMQDEGKSSELAMIG